MNNFSACGYINDAVRPQNDTCVSFAALYLSICLYTLQVWRVATHSVFLNVCFECSLYENKHNRQYTHTSGSRYHFVWYNSMLPSTWFLLHVIIVQIIIFCDIIIAYYPILDLGYILYHVCKFRLRTLHGHIMACKSVLYKLNNTDTGPTGSASKSNRGL